VIRCMVLTLCLSVPAWAGDPAQYDLVQSPRPSCPAGQYPALITFGATSTLGEQWECVSIQPSMDREAAVLTMPAAKFQAQLDRIEQMLRAICSTYTVRTKNAVGTLSGCPNDAIK
jgi:hypothetical protein